MKVRKVLYSISDLFIQEFWYKNWVRTSLRPVSAKILKSPCPTLTESFFQPKINNCVRTTFKLPKYILSSHFVVSKQFYSLALLIKKLVFPTKFYNSYFTSRSGRRSWSLAEERCWERAPSGPPLGARVLIWLFNWFSM